MTLFDLLKKGGISFRSSEARDVELISLHLPKTAGSSFGEVLTRVYGKEKILFDYEDRPLDPTAQVNSDFSRWMKEKDAFIRDIPPSTRVIHGHFPIAKYAGSFASAKKIIWLREPVSRLVSHYFYWKKSPHQNHALHKAFLEKNMGLLEFAEIPIMRNILSRIFLREADISQFYFVGIQEFFEDDLSQLAAMLKWPLHSAPELNRNRESRYGDFHLDGPLLEQLTRLNLQDVEIYQTALKLRAERLRKAGNHSAVLKGRDAPGECKL